MKKKYLMPQLLILVCFSLLLGKPLFVRGDTQAGDGEIRSERLGEDFHGDSTQKDRGDTTRSSQGYYFWRVTNKSVIGYPYGAWRNGPSGRGPATLSLTNSRGYNTSVTNTISGSYTSVSTISASLGITIGLTKTYGVTYSVSVPKGSTYQIKYRPQFKRYKVVETQYYRIDGYTRQVGQKISYVDVFYSWNYTWVRK